MPFNGSGTFARVYNWVTDKNNSIDITASRMDTEDTGFATGLSLCLTKDGQQLPTANLPMNGFAHTGVGNATLSNQYAVVSQVQSQSYSWIAAGGTADAITATYAPALTSLTDGLVLKFRATAANATTTPTFAPNGLTAHTITKEGGTALAAGDIAGALAECEVVYNLANTRWELMNPYVLVPASGSVTNAMLANMAADTVKVNNTSGSSAPTDLTMGASTVLARLATGDIVAATPAQVSALLGILATVKRQVFTSGGTYTPSSGMVYCDIELWGGGGGGGGSTSTAGRVGAGGGAGGYAKKAVSASTIGASQTITIGTGGTAGANSGGTGGAGGTTSVGSIVSATGGAGGVGLSATGIALGGQGGLGSSGDINARGAWGSIGVDNNNVNISGAGGNTSLGGAGYGQDYTLNTSGISATSNSGSGGGGGASNGSAQIGGVGGSGFVVITEYCSQ